MRILIELPSWLGDTVMASAAIENLINFHKQCEVVIVGSKISIEVLKGHPKVSKTYILYRSYLSMFVLSRDLRKFDKFVTFRNSFRSNLFKLMVSSNQKFQYNKNKYQKYPLHNSHSEFGFLEPIKYFNPSIGISQIISLNNEDQYVVAYL